MPDQSSYADTVSSLDSLRREKEALSKQKTVPQTVMMPAPGPKGTLVMQAKTIQKDNPEFGKVPDQEKQTATLLDAIQKTKMKLRDAKNDFINLSASKNPDHEDLMDAAHNVTRFENALDYFHRTGKELLGSKWDVLTSPLNEEIAVGMRK